MAGNHWLQITYVANRNERIKTDSQVYLKNKNYIRTYVCPVCLLFQHRALLKKADLNYWTVIHCIVDLNVICVCIYCTCSFTWFGGTKDSSHQTPFDCSLQCRDCLYLHICWLPIFPAFWWSWQWVHLKTTDQCKLMLLQNHITKFFIPKGKPDIIL